MIISKLDEVKELIGFLKAIFITLIIINTSLIAWIFKNYNSETGFRLYIVTTVIATITLMISILFSKILKEIKRLENLP